MKQLAKIINEQTGLCDIALGDNKKFFLSQGFVELDVQKSDIDGNWYLTDKCPMKSDEEKDKEERERLNMLYMTGSDVERAIYKVKGIDFDDILAMLKDNPAIDAKALKIEFKANNFYRGNPYISQVGTFLGFTSEQMDKFFETKDYHYLTTCTLAINATPKEAVITGTGSYLYGTTAHYKVECEGYVTQEGDIEMLQDTELNIELEATDKENLTVDEEDE